VDVYDRLPRGDLMQAAVVIAKPAAKAVEAAPSGGAR
jgi:hypothetical protein